MKLDNFEKSIRDYIIEHFSKIESDFKSKKIYPGSNDVFFPSLILFIRTKNHHCIEFIGNTNSVDEIVFRKHIVNSINTYINSFLMREENSYLLQIKDSYQEFSHLVFSQTKNYDKVQVRYPMGKVLERYPKITPEEDVTTLLNIDGNKGVIFLNDIYLVYKREKIYRLKFIKDLLIIGNDECISDAKTALNSIINEKKLFGVSIFYNDDDKRAFEILQFKSLIMTSKLRETTIGDFINKHKEIFLNVFSADKLLYEPYLKWNDKIEENEDEAINPDLILINNKNEAIVIDLKTALINRARLTKAKRKRRRFIDYVYEGISQLAHYRDYLSNPLNTDEVIKKLGDNLVIYRYVLVVGNSENYQNQDILEASRGIDSIEIIDFETIADLYIKEGKFNDCSS